MKLNSAQDNIKTGDISIHPSLGQIEVKGKLIKLGLVNMQVLMTLVENQGQVVSRNTLFDTVWKNQVVSDDTLTRCISDLRKQLSQHSSQQFIETLPKRGYKWLPEALQGEENQPLMVKKGRMYGFLLLIILLLTLSVGTLWVANLIVKPDQVRIALIPVQAETMQHKLLASEIEDMLRTKLLATNELRFLSSQILTDRQQNPFSYLSREFNAQWVIEGTVRAFRKKTRITLNVVDARTALVMQTLVTDTKVMSSEGLDVYCQQFIDNMLSLINQ